MIKQVEEQIKPVERPAFSFTAFLQPDDRLNTVVL